MSAGPEILRLRNAAISRPGCFAWNRGNDDPLFFTPCFDRLPFYPKSFLPLVRQRRVIPPGTQTAYSKGYISSLVGHSVVKVHGLDRRQSAQTRRGRYACAAWRLVEMCLNLSNVIKLAAKEETAEDHRILKELQKELIRKKRQQKQTEAAPSEKGYRRGQRAEA